MASNTTYLITGANRGIGLGMTASLLLRPNTTIITTIRSTETSIDGLKALPKASGSMLITVPLSFEMLRDPAMGAIVVRTLRRDWRITHIDTIIANAGTAAFDSILTVPLSSLETHYQTNTLLPILLFQALHPLLALAPDPKFILISTVLSSISVGCSEGDVLAYGMSKAAANYFVRKLHFDFPQITAVAVHPGWVRTENGQRYADSLKGYDGEPPLTVQASVEGVLKVVSESLFPSPGVA